MKEKTICFTGHRTIRTKDGDIAASLRGLIEILINRGYKYFGAGGAIGFDTIAAETIVNLQCVYPDIRLILVLPFRNQYTDGKWTKEEIKKYNDLIYKAAKVVYIQDKYSSGVYYKRNRHLIDNSSLCIAYQYKNTGGTAYTTRYAKEQNCRVIDLIEYIKKGTI